MMGCSEHDNENLGPTVRGELFDWLNNCRFLKKKHLAWGRCFIPRNAVRSNYVLRSDAGIRMSSRSQTPVLLPGFENWPARTFHVLNIIIISLGVRYEVQNNERLVRRWRPSSVDPYISLSVCGPVWPVCNGSAFCSVPRRSGCETLL
jgi:hypothetical protein